jgi:hypothetical protein
MDKKSVNNKMGTLRRIHKDCGPIIVRALVYLTTIHVLGWPGAMSSGAIWPTTSVPSCHGQNNGSKSEKIRSPLRLPEKIGYSCNWFSFQKGEP